MVPNYKIKLRNGILRFSNYIPQKIYLKIIFKLSVGYRLNLKHPKTFNEKIQWLKLNDHKSIYPIIVDKLSVKNYINEKLGEGYVFNTIGVWNNPKNIDFESLPNRFVLKTTHGGGNCGVIICKDKSKFNIENAIRELKKALHQDIGHKFLEWPYTKVNPRIMAEEFMEQPDCSELVDYKVHCFNGTPQFILVCSGRNSEFGMHEDFYDTEWNRLDCARRKHPISSFEIEKPTCLSELLSLAKILAEGFPFLRVDFYIINNKLYVGELTLYPASGFSPFVPQEMDLRFGELLGLPSYGEIT